MHVRSLQFCTVQREGPLTIVTLARPEVLNALHAPANFELSGVFDDFSADPAQAVAIITGAGARAFCAGNDLKHQAAGGDMTRAPGGFGGLTVRHTLDKPVIAAVNGIAMGGGFELALACDLIIASSDAFFALPEPRVGMAALGGGIQRLARQIGMKQAAGLLLTGRRVDARDGERLGFVNEVAAPGTVLAAARRWAGLMLECSPAAVRATKQAVRLGLEERDLGKAIEAQRSYPAVRAMLESEDYVEGPLAFAQKRKPAWQLG